MLATLTVDAELLQTAIVNNESARPTIAARAIDDPLKFQPQSHWYQNKLSPSTHILHPILTHLIHQINRKNLTL
jgi:hypothetical protein